jgi:hypothetical protein
VRALSIAFVLAAATTAAAQPASPQPGTATFFVQIDGRRAGTADVTLQRTPTGWSIRGASRLGAPLDLVVGRYDITYTAEWKPTHVTLDMSAGAQTAVVHGGFTEASGARIEIIRGGRQVVFVTAPVAGDALILPNLVFGAFEALAARLQGAAPGAALPAYMFPHREVPVRVDAVKDEDLGTGSRRLRTRRWTVLFMDPAAAARTDVWVDQGRLARLDLPDSRISVVRQDLAGR